MSDIKDPHIYTILTVYFIRSCISKPTILHSYFPYVKDNFTIYAIVSPNKFLTQWILSFVYIYIDIDIHIVSSFYCTHALIISILFLELQIILAKILCYYTYKIREIEKEHFLSYQIYLLKENIERIVFFLFGKMVIGYK